MAEFNSFIVTMFILLSLPSFGKSNWRDINRSLSQASPDEIIRIHYQVLKMSEAIDQEREIKDKRSTFWSFFFNEAVAGSQDRCFFAGWMSIEVNGSCQEPWVVGRSAAFQQEYPGHLYNSDYYCKNRSDSGNTDNLVRCNPLLYGADSEGGKCVSISPNSSISERCYQASSGLIENHINSFLESETNRSRYATLVEELINYCSRKRTFTCHSMAKQLEWQLNTLSYNPDVRSCAPGFIDNFFEIPEFQEILRLVNEPPEEVPEIWSPPMDASDACNIEGMGEQARANCEDLLGNGDVPRNALLFALEGMKRNATSFNTDKCFDNRPEFESRFSDRNGHKHQSLPGLNSSTDFRSKLENGIPNKCKMIINDVGDRSDGPYPPHKCKMKTYVIDLCGSSPNVRSTKSWMGYGTCKGRSGYTNIEGRGTTLLGFHVTGVQTFPFSKDDSSYNKIRNDYAKTRERRVPALALFGLQQSNNGSMTDYKYLHIGAYTSAGCPSMMPTVDNYDLIEELAMNGPSVLVNYKEGEMEPYQKCEEQ